jgi:hypothetical protein
MTNLLKPKKRKVENKKYIGGIRDIISNNHGRSYMVSIIGSALVLIIIYSIMSLSGFLEDKPGYKDYIANKPLSPSSTIQGKYDISGKVENYSIVITKNMDRHFCREIEEIKLTEVEKDGSVKEEKKVSYFDIDNKVIINKNDIIKIITFEDEITSELPLDIFDDYSNSDRPAVIDNAIGRQIEKTLSDFS